MIRLESSDMTPIVAAPAPLIILSADGCLSGWWLLSGLDTQSQMVIMLGILARKMKTQTKILGILTRNMTLYLMETPRMRLETRSGTRLETIVRMRSGTRLRTVLGMRSGMFMQQTWG